ncbi:MAG: hypothetical protein KDD04_04090, partial [Sinomicrobium sp.]|nr:hypothetical protein [Sinomicrobium sp.]
TYLYLPTRARLALDEEKEPKFSFMRYITERQSAEASANTVTEAGGGGILHFLILYDTPEEQIQGAQAALRQKLENDKIIIRGPMVFDSGKYTLISSILNRDTGAEERKVLSIGEAPVLENSSIALSFDVSPLDSKLLLESFKMDTPDISLIFELAFSGLSDSYDATLEIDWSEVKKSKSFGAGGSIYFIGADVEMGFDELLKNNAIRLITTGSNASMEALLNTVYNKLLEVMFKPVEAASVPPEQRGSMMDAITALTGSGGLLSSGNTTGFGLSASYQLKEMRIQGKSDLFFKGRSTISRHHFVTFNIGDLYQKYGKDERFFRDVPLWDPAFQQREVYVGIDGDLEKEFESMLNSVTVTLRKKHLNGAETLADILIKKESFKDYEGRLSMRYLNQGDTVRTDWLKYEYKTSWKFKGGGGYETPWQTENSAMVNLFIPFQRRSIHLEGDMELFKEKDIRAVSVQISYPFFDRTKQHRVTIRPGDDLNEKAFEITLPNNVEDVNYKITWIRKNGSKQETEGVDNFGIIFIDEIPDQE